MRSIQKVLRSVLELQSRCTMFLLWSVLIDGSWRGEVYRVYARWCCANTFFDVWWRIQWNRRGRTQVLEIICWAARYDRCNWDGDALGNRFVGINPLTHEQFIDEEKGGLVMEKECVQCLCLMLQWTKLDSFIWLQTERPRLYDQCILWHQCASLLQLLHQHSCKIPEDLKRLSGGKGPFADAGKVVHYETATRGLTEVYANATFTGGGFASSVQHFVFFQCAFLLSTMELPAPQLHLLQYWETVYARYQLKQQQRCISAHKMH